MTSTVETNLFRISEEQSMLIDAARRFVRETDGVNNHGALKNGERSFCPARWRTFADLGWLGIAVPEANGGFGGSLKDVAALMEGVGPGLLPDPLISSAIFATTIIDEVPESALRTKWLERMAAGDAVVAVAHEEIGISEPTQIRARKAGSGFRADGASILSWAASDADAFVVFARLEGGEPALFLVDRASSNVTLESYRLIDGSMAADIHFTDVLLDESSLLAAGEVAQAAFNLALDRAIVAHASMIIGIARDAMTMTGEFLKTRVQFGGPIARFQALQHRVAEMFIQYQDGVSALHFAIEACERQDPVERAIMVSAAKVVIGDAARYIGSQAIQLHGAIGVTEEYRIGHFYRKILVFQAMFGDAGFHRARYERLKSA